MKKFNRYIIEIEFEGRKLTEYVAKESFIIGRSSECDIHIESKNLSRQHMKVSLVGSEIFIEDLKSTNGCFLGGEQIEAGQLVLYSPEKILTLGKHEDVVLTLKAKFDTPKGTSPKEVKENLGEIFNKDPMNLSDPAPKKAERDYKEIMNQVEILKTEIIERAEKRADKILADAKVEADKLISETKKNSEDLVAQAKANADKMIADAVEQSKNVKEQTELSDLLRQIEDKKTEVERVNEIIATCRENLKSLELKNTEFIELEEKNTALEVKIKSLESKNNAMLENQKDIEGKIAISTQDLEKLISEKDAIQATFTETTAKNKELEADLTRKQTEIEKLNNVKTELSAEVADLNQKRKDFEELQAAYEKVENELNEKNEAFKEVLLEVQNVNTDLKALKDLQLSLQSDNTKQKVLIDEEKENIARLQKEFEDFLEKKKTLLTEIEEINSKKDSCVHELAELNNKVASLDKECSSKVKRATDEADLIISQAKAKAQSEYIALMQKSKQDIVDKEENLLSHARTQAKEILEKAQAEAKKIDTEVQTLQSEMAQKAEIKAEKIIKDSQTRADELRDRAQAEYQNVLKEAEIEADKIKVHSLQMMDEKKKDFVELEKKRIKKSSEILKSELNVLLYSKLKLYLKEDSEEYAARVKSSLDAAVNSSMLNEVLDNDEEMYALLDDQVLKQQKKTINYWRFTVPGVVLSLIAVYFAVPFLKEKIKDESRKVASVSKKKTEERIKKMDEEAKKELFEFFSPLKTKEFKSTYTDRVLYTERYAELSLEKEYREDWILELKAFFVDELDLNVNALVPFISQEANMIRELVAQSKRINGKFIEQGIEKMREIEDEFVVKLKSNLRNDNDYKKIMKFQEKFFKKRAG